MKAGGNGADDAKITPLPTECTDGWSLTHITLILGEDYNQATSVLRSPAGVHQVRLLTPFFTNMRTAFDLVHEVVVNNILRAPHPPIFDGCPEQNSTPQDVVQHTWTPNDLSQLLSPPDNAFNHGHNVRHFHHGKHGKVRLGSPELEPMLPPPIVLAHDKLKVVAKAAGAEESGALFLYPEGHGMGFHTNLDNEQSNKKIRGFSDWLIRSVACHF